MLNRFIRLICCMLFALPISTTANATIIHWELDSSTGAYTDGYVKGGFDFNTVTNEINNITAEVFTNGHGCIQCMLYDNATVSYFPGSQSILEFNKQIYTDNVLYLDAYFSIGASGYFIDSTWILTPFDLAVPGIYSGLEYWERGYLRLDNPMDPSMYSQDNCSQCAVAIGTLIAVPEPETYAMLLAGFGIIGWRVKSDYKANTAPRVKHAIYAQSDRLST